MMSSSLVKNSGPKLSPQSDVRVRDTGEGHIMRQYSEEKKRRLKSTARDVKTPQLPELHCLLARHDTTGKPAKPMMPDAATQTSSSDHFEESSRRYAKWEEEVRLEEVRHLQRVAIGLFKFSMHKATMLAPMPAEEEEEEDEENITKVGCWSFLRHVFCGFRLFRRK
ncbi:uncharacterized protein [Periplaneta americana]|uniref:uncharacterized protein isoform X2 n=1 Tax=Periplaneta americana TaxID=6978 RepID=UPI0037E99789